MKALVRQRRKLSYMPLVLIWALASNYTYGKTNGDTTNSYSATISVQKAFVLNTNFCLPIARFNFYDHITDNSTGRLLLFNSLGAGISINYGSVEITNAGTNNDEAKFYNFIGLQFGILFSGDVSKANSTFTFAPTVSLEILDFQIGYGYELGKTSDYESRHFMIVSYGIPIQKLVKKGMYIFHAYGQPNKTSPHNNQLL